MGRTISTNQENQDLSEEIPDRFLKLSGIRPKFRLFGLFLVIIGLVQVGVASSQSVKSIEIDASGTEFSAVIASDAPVGLELANDPEETAGFVISEVSALLGSDSPFVEDEKRGPLTRDTIATYTIKEGDTLSAIAEQFGISINTILWSNEGLSAKRLKVGTEIAILPVSGAKHIVASGDNLSYLAKKYKVSVLQIKEANKDKIVGDQLKIGQELIIPGGTVSGPSTGVSFKESYSNDLPSSGGYFIMPTKGYNWGQRHDGNAVDIANACGTAIYAAAAGTVQHVGSGWNGGYGNSVKISHSNGAKSVYAHMKSISVVSGQVLAQGEHIGAVGNTGRSTGCHLHFLVEGMSNPFVIY